MDTLQTSLMKTESNLNDIAQRQNLTTPRGNKNTEPISKRPDAMSVDDDPPVSLQISTVTAEVPYPVSNLAKTTGSNFAALLEDVRHPPVPYRVANISTSTDKIQFTGIPCVTTNLRFQSRHTP